MSSNGQHKISRKAVASDNPLRSPEPQRPAQDGQSRLVERSGGLHWRAYTTMVASLLFGILLALGHHLFYSHLNGKPVGAPEHVIKGVTRQQLNLTLGTLFAFLVSSFLGVAVTTSYTQIVWRAIKKRTTTLATIDTIFHVVTNFWSLAFFSVWWKYPRLLLLALTIWLVPIASVITPAALTVAVAGVNPVDSTMLRVPNVDFLSLNFANIQAELGSFAYLSPRYAVDKVAAATAAQGAILAIAPPAANSSWIVDFADPSIMCTDLQGSPLDAIKENIQKVAAIDRCETAFGYIAWTPSYLPTSVPGANYELYTLPFILSSNDTSYALNYESLGPLPRGINGAASIPATFYAANFYNMTNKGGNGGASCSGFKFDHNLLPNITVLQCQLYNASYHVSFLYKNGDQIIDITVDENPYNSVTPILDLDMTYAEGLLASYKNGSVTEYNTTEVKTLSYQSVMDSFGQIVVGTIWNSVNTLGSAVASNTSVMSTVLGEAEELAWLNGYPPKQPDLVSTLQQAIAAERPGQMWNGLDIVDDFQSATPFKVALETLFQNITVGLMSSKLLQPNTSSPYAPPLTNVTLPHFQTVYVYTPFRLWIAYGLSILLATTAVFIGLSSMFSSGIAYTNHFSTIMRAARHANMETNIRPEDADGKDPLPKYLAKASVSFPNNYEGGEKRGMSWIGDSKSPGVSSRLLSE